MFTNAYLFFMWFVICNRRRWEEIARHQVVIIVENFVIRSSNVDSNLLFVLLKWKRGFGGLGGNEGQEDGKWEFSLDWCGGNEGGRKRGWMEFSTWAHQETFLLDWEEKWGRKCLLHGLLFIQILFSILSLSDPLYMRKYLKHFLSLHLLSFLHFLSAHFSILPTTQGKTETVYILSLFYYSYIFYFLTFNPPNQTNP